MKYFSLRKIAKEGMAREVIKTIEKLAEKDSLKEWSNTLNYTLPTYQKPKKLPLSAGLYNFIKFNVLQLLP